MKHGAARWPWVLLLGVLSSGAALGQHPSPSRLRDPEPEPTRAPQRDGGKPALSREDQEIVDNLELLEHLEEVKNLELLRDL